MTDGFIGSNPSFQSEMVENQAPKMKRVPVELSSTRPGISCLAISYMVFPLQCMGSR